MTHIFNKIVQTKFIILLTNFRTFSVQTYWFCLSIPVKNQLIPSVLHFYWRYLYNLKQWLPLSATTIWPSKVMVKPWGPYKGQPKVLTNDKNEPWLSKTWILEFPQSATKMLSWLSTAIPVGALNCPFPSPLEPKQKRNSPLWSNTWNNEQRYQFNRYWYTKSTGLFRRKKWFFGSEILLKNWTELLNLFGIIC